MNLYKYIDFNSPYWDYPLKETRLHFSTVEELRTVNDQEEFNHSWNHTSLFFNQYGSHFSDSYTKLLLNSRILCLGKNLNKTCWDTFVPSGSGVCYEFSYKKNGGDVTSDHITYNDSKILNVPSYILESITDGAIENILRRTDKLSPQDLASTLDWFKSKELSSIFENHILHEMTLKKKTRYRREREYRFIHIVDPMGPIQPQVKLVDSKTRFEDIGLRLTRVYTDNPGMVKAIEKSAGINVHTPRFL